MTLTLKRPALRYHGGKWKIAPWIISHFKEHVCYVEPFAGGASVLLRKPEAKCEVLNDLDGEVVNFWKILRTQTEEFVRQVELTPFSREEVDLAREEASDDLERARRFFIRSWQSRGGATAKYAGGWRFVNGQSRGNVPARDWSRTESLWAAAARLKSVQIEHDDAISVIQRFDRPKTLFYVDPPYIGESRTRRWAGNAYNEEVGEEFHVKLAAILEATKGMVVLSGYASPLYDRLYSHWERKEHLTGTDGGDSKVECLWIKLPR